MKEDLGSVLEVRSSMSEIWVGGAMIFQSVDRMAVGKGRWRYNALTC